MLQRLFKLLCLLSSRSLTCCGVPRDSRWPKFEHGLIEERGECERCGNRDKKQLGGHHRLPVSKDKSKELDPENIAIVCFTGALACHLNDHLGNYRSYDPESKQHNEEFRARIKSRP